MRPDRFGSRPPAPPADPVGSPAARLAMTRAEMARSDRTSPLPRQKAAKGISRGNLAARLLAAIPANYLLTSLATAALARLLAQGLGVPPVEASESATLLSFAVFAVLAIVVFSVRSIARLWIGFVLAAAVMGGWLWLSLETGGRL
ncbi:hypothetical protein [Sphingomonas sp. IC081]|uniref:hypothetical protein n=1 Tax=Sphingomonas sp. IC081 TaxID=304378 RepID=UPI0021AF9988|nr:hypothetical protein [Sphingomonas sp. IC081]